jgi:hypothetical protein
MGESSEERLEITDFAIGLLNAVQEVDPSHVLNCRDRTVDRGFEDASKYLLHLIDTYEVKGLNMRFRIAPHPLHGDSENVFEVMSFLASIGYVTHLRNQYYRFERGTNEDARTFHEKKRIPGDYDLYRRLASRFVLITSGYEVEPILEAAR